MPSILFVCVHNACRSQIAEVICRELTDGNWNVSSAGSNPSTQVDSKAVEILKRNNLFMNSIVPKGFSDLPDVKWDYVVGMGCGDRCPANVHTSNFIEWEIPDPEDGPMELYEALYADLHQRISSLVGQAQKSVK